MAGISGLNRDVEVNNNTGGGGDFQPIAADDYELEIVASDVKANSKATGKNLEYDVQVVSGPHKGYKFRNWITSIEHESKQSQTIGQGQLKALCSAAGVDFTTLGDSEELHYRPFWATVIIDDPYTDKNGKERRNNKISKFLWEGMPEDETPTPAAKAAATPAPSPTPSPAPAATGSRPWARKG